MSILSRESARLISSLDADSRYILFKQHNDAFTAVICSQISDEELSTVVDGEFNPWQFSNREKAVRSVRRLNKNIQIYIGNFNFESSHAVQ